MDVSPQKFGELRESNHILSDETALRTRMRDEGYLFFRGLLDRKEVLEARREILLKYATIGEIDPRCDVMDAIYCKTESIEDAAISHVNLRAFSESVRSGQAYLNVVLHQQVMDFWSRIFGTEALCFDMRWPRFVRPSEGCGFHADGPYLSRGSQKVSTSWIPLGDVDKHEGALIILEHSHKNETLLNTYAKKDADRDKLAWLSTNPLTLQERFGGRWLSTDFRAGDVLCFSKDMLHGALDNHSPIGKCRLTSDTRYQPANEPLDERWNGDNFAAHGHDMVFFPGLGHWNNKNFQDEWKYVDENGRLVLK
ncbi:phytanoyl-CoA dioxygenase family protein [Chloroflexi bacterium TSY]|nr:phytanoyl-CoA dioxygenase family protein [Chloroflexi bacterium TSY]